MKVVGAPSPRKLVRHLMKRWPTERQKLALAQIGASPLDCVPALDRIVELRERVLALAQRDGAAA